MDIPRNYTFVPENFVAAGLEPPQIVAQLLADLTATYQPVNSQELFAVERMALAQLSILRAARMAGALMAAGVEQANRENPELAASAEDPLAEGFRRLNRTSDLRVFLSYQAQSERFYRRAVEDFNRLKRMRSLFANSSQPDRATKAAPPASPVPTSEPPAARHSLDPGATDSLQRPVPRAASENLSATPPVLPTSHPPYPDLCPTPTSIASAESHPHRSSHLVAASRSPVDYTNLRRQPPTRGISLVP